MPNRVVGAYVIPYDSFLSVKYEEDLNAIETIDLEYYMRSAYQ